MPQTSDVVDRIDLVDVVSALRTSLGEAQERSPGEDVQFEVGPVEITLSVAVTKDATVGGEAGGKVRFWVFNADAKASASAGLSTTSTQTITLTLTPFDSSKPVDAEGKRAKVTVEGTAIEGEV